MEEKDSLQWKSTVAKDAMVKKKYQKTNITYLNTARVMSPRCLAAVQFAREWQLYHRVFKNVYIQIHIQYKYM